MTEIDLIYQDVTKTNQINISNSFNNSDFIFITTPDLEAGEEYIIALSIVINILGITTKEIPLNSEAGDTALIIKIPSEISKQKFACNLIIITTEPIRLEIYSVRSGCTNCDLEDILEEIKEQIEIVEENQDLIISKLEAIEQAIQIGNINSGNNSNIPENTPINSPNQNTINPALEP